MGDATSRQGSFANGFAPVGNNVTPVVNIASPKIVRSPDQGSASPFFSNPFFANALAMTSPLGFRVPREEREQSLGSGVLLNADGYVLTTNHVVARPPTSRSLSLALADFRQPETNCATIGRPPRYPNSQIS